MNEINEQTKVPFYMTYPLQNLYLMEMEYEKDMERMKQLYPHRVKLLLPYIEEFCDGLEYEGSRIYDENPDMRMMREAQEKLLRRVREQEFSEGTEAPEEMPQPDDKAGKGRFSLYPPEEWGFPLAAVSDPADRPTAIPEASVDDKRMPETPADDSGSRTSASSADEDWLSDMIGVLFEDEIYRRRCRHRRCQRWW